MLYNKIFYSSSSSYLPHPPSSPFSSPSSLFPLLPPPLRSDTGRYQSAVGLTLSCKSAVNSKKKRKKKEKKPSSSSSASYNRMCNETPSAALRPALSSPQSLSSPLSPPLAPFIPLHPSPLV